MDCLCRYVIALLAVCSLQACSTAPKPNPTIPGKSARQHMMQRVGAIVVTDRTDIGSWVSRGFPQSQSPGDADGGSATPLTADGYFLTADHVLERIEGRRVFIIYARGGQLTAHRARVVWRSGGSDLALLHITAETPLHYQFTDPQRWLPLGTPILHGGVATGLKSEPGKLSSSIPPERTFTPSRKFKIDIPLQPGDSGGPVLDAFGGLIGINSAVEFLIPMETAFFVNSEANRPNVRMIESLIRKDRAARSQSGGDVE